MGKNDILKTIRNDLKENADEKTKTSSQKFFKEEAKFYGVTVPRINKIAKERFILVKNLSKQEIFSLCEELFKSGYCEESLLAANWVYLVSKQFEKSDFIVFEDWVNKYIDNWAECDILCNHSLGTLITMYPEFIEKLKVWTKSPNRWVRRASAVALILPARKGKFLKDIFQIADSLLTDKDDMVQKGYGWMLKETSKAHQKEVFEYVMKNKKVMPRTVLRYAIEKLPTNFRLKAMKK